MPTQIRQITTFSAQRYSENRDTRPKVARAYMVIINQAHAMMLTTADVADLLDFLSKPHIDPDLAKTCKEVLEHIGTTP
jgi:hypothetical protein